MQSDILQDIETKKNSQKHVSFGKNDVIVINSDECNIRATEQQRIQILINPRNIIGRFIEDVRSGKKDINFQNEDKDSALTLACSYHFYKDAHSLIDRGIDVNLTNYKKRTALMYAAKLGEFSLVEELLKSGSIVRTQDNNGDTALLWALKSYAIEDEDLRLKIVEALVSKDPSTINQANVRG